MAVQLTKNFIEALYKNEYEHFENPIVQVLNIKSTQLNTNRVIISDGIYFMQTLMSSQLFEKSSKIKKNSLIKIKKCISNRIQKNGVVSIFGILLEFDVLPYENLEKIGTPKNIQEVYPPSTINGYEQNKDNHMNEPQNNKPVNNNTNNNNKNSPNSVNIFPIKSLSPYQNRWTIRAKAINKGLLRNYSNSRGNGKLFSVIFIDDSGEIKATAFNEACDRFYDIIEEGRMYYISGCTIKVANKRFNNCKHDYEMNIDSHANITICNDANIAEPKMHYSFVPLNQLMSIEKDYVIDVIGVVDQVGDVVELVSKSTNKPVS